MRKLKLELAELEVTSFAAEAVRQERPGTIAGRAADTYGGTCDGACNASDTCKYMTCAHSCLDSCGAMCYSVEVSNCDFCVTGTVDECPR
ncbi:MAG TPA: hypothetical protein VFS20_17100 [Longimicrobium sp.]|nr:hypothetical protein [Longimicrobium sp.]